ncbi:MAG: APC family permease [Proteobacteria bacterium]|nr:APC family permease [Pseudomonadota bacterium]
MNQTTAGQKGQVVRGIGLFGGVLLVLNGMIGAGIFALPPAVVARAGVLSPWLFLAAGVLIITVVLTFAELSSYFRISGGPALYATKAFGPLTGFSTGWIYFVSRAASIAANCHVMAIFLGALLPWFDTDIGHSVVVVVVVSALTLVNVLGIKGGVRALSFFTFFKLIPLLIMILLGLQTVSPDVLFPENMPTIDDLGGTMLLLIYAFLGFEQVLIPAGETANPRKTIPNALVITMITTGILYFLIVLVYVSVIASADPGTTLVDVGRKLAGPVGAIVITLTAIFSIAGNLSSTMLAAPRLTQSLADHRLLPQWFGRISEKYASPANSIVFLGGIAMVLGLSGSFVLLAIATSLTRLIIYFICIAALPVIKAKADPEAIERAYKIKGGYTIPLLAAGICLWMISHTSADSWKLTGVLFVVGLAFFWLEQLRIKRQNAA